MVLNNKTVLIDQYANDRGPSQGPPPWSWNMSSFWTFDGSRKFACFLIFENAKNHSYLQSAWSKVIFPDISPTTQIPWHFPVFPDLQEPCVQSAEDANESRLWLLTNLKEQPAPNWLNSVRLSQRPPKPKMRFIPIPTPIPNPNPISIPNHRSVSTSAPSD